MLHDILLLLHIIAGTIGLLLGPLVLAVPKRAGWHPRLGRPYLVVVAAMTSTAIVLAVLDPSELWFLGLIAAATAAAALVVNWSSPLTWLLPTLVASPLIAWTSRRASLSHAAPSPSTADAPA